MDTNEGQGSAAQGFLRIRTRGKWLGRWELLTVLLMCLMFAFSFKLSSPVHGLHPTNAFPTEVFEQDSYYIISAMVDGERFRYNPQHHLLYHVLTEWGYNVLRPHTYHSLRKVYLFLKGFTVLTGIAFTILLSRLLWEMDLRLYHRILLLLLSGISVSAWFNFSAFETHSLGMAGIALYLLVILRLTRLGQFQLQEQFMLGVSLVFMLLCRTDLARFFVATALLIPLPRYRAHWRRLVLVLAAALLAGSLLYTSLASVYLDRPMSEVPKVLFQREDPDLAPILGTVRNLTAENLSRMTLATTVSTVIMPIGKRKFVGPLEGMGEHAGAMLTVALWIVLLLIAGWATWKNRKNSGPLAACILMNWGVGLLLYTWFNPHEPFLWLLEFLPLLVAFMGNGLKKIGNKVWVLISIGILFILIHNIMFFYLPYRVYG
ncbi:MAG: hypothetical protein NCA08_00080 [Deltaproteobacteria bacterium]|nr:hypothetical protein [Candidatus Deferrimicrobium borealis]